MKYYGIFHLHLIEFDPGRMDNDGMIGGMKKRENTKRTQAHGVCSPRSHTALDGIELGTPRIRDERSTIDPP